jgi:hypothetical protein
LNCFFRSPHDGSVYAGLRRRRRKHCSAQPVAVSGGSACPVKAHQLSSAGSIAIRWSTALNTNPVTVVTQSQTASGRLTEIEQVITQSMAVWTGVGGTTLVPATLTALTRTATQNACGSDGMNSICFDQADTVFTPGVLAFTRVIETDRLGIQVGSSAVATQLGQIHQDCRCDKSVLV